MDYLREGVHLRAFAQKDPLVEYRGEGHKMFEELGLQIREEVVGTLFHAQLAPQDAEVLEQRRPAERRQPLLRARDRPPEPARSPARRVGGGFCRHGRRPGTRPDREHAAGRQVNENQKLGRNDPCWCGSGKKFKKCHGA